MDLTLLMTFLLISQAFSLSELVHSYKLCSTDFLTILHIGFCLSIPYLSLFVEKIYNVHNFSHLRIIKTYLSNLIENFLGLKTQCS